MSTSSGIIQVLESRKASERPTVQDGDPVAYTPVKERYELE